MLRKDMLTSDAWKNLTKSEMLVYIYIKKNFNGSNKAVSLKYSELKGIITDPTLSKAIKGLIYKEWIKKEQHGGMYRYYCTYTLTGKHDKGVVLV